MFTVYVLKSTIALKSYVGVTNDLARRLREHNAGNHFYTKQYMPWLVLHQEQFETFGDARRREKYLKTAAGRRFLKTLFN